MLRSILAVIAGYAILAIATMLLLIPVVLAFGLPLDPSAVKTPPGTAYVLCNLAVSFAAAALGGFVTARIAGRQEALILSAIVLILGALYGLSERTPASPKWYLAVLPFVGAAGVAIGGYLSRPRAIPK